MRKDKQGISLIVLVITIIVMIILAAAIIISLENTGIIGAAENAVCKTNIKQAQNLAVLVWSNIYTNPDEYTMDNVEDKLREEFEKNGLKYEDYNVEVTKNGINVSSKAGCTDSSGVEGGSGDTGSDTIPTNWVYAYSYDKTADTWTTLRTNNGTEPTGDIVVRYYVSKTYTEGDLSLDMYKLVASGQGELNLYDIRDSENEIYVQMPASTYESDTSGLPISLLVTEIEIQNGITAIGERAFAFGYTNFLESVKLADSVKIIGSRAFEDNCLKSINLSNIEEIGNGAFNGCAYLENIELSNKLTAINDKTFRSCNALKNIVVPEGIETIGKAAFQNCTGLQSISLPSTLKSIVSVNVQYDGVFNGCTSLQSITIPAGCELGAGLFTDCTGLKSVTILEGITTINSGMFNGCTSLTEVNLPNSITTIKNNAFTHCENLKNITLPSELTTIDSYAFIYTGLETLTVPDKVTSISTQTFGYCKSLESIVLPATITWVNSSTFEGSNNLKTIKYRGTEAQWNSIASFDTSFTATVEFNYTGN